MSVEIEARLAELVGPVLAPLAPEERPAIIALAERIAAERYRVWAGQVDDEPVRTRLLACAAREDEIASRVEAIVPAAQELQARATAEHGELPARYAELFAGLPLPEQFALQARAERAGAGTWRSLSASATGAEAETYRACAELEETSAAELDAMIAEGVGA